MTSIHDKPASGFKIAASIEATPRQVIDADALTGLFPLGTRVYLTDIGGPFGEIGVAARRLAAAGYRPVPHFAARRIASRTELLARLEILTGESGVEEAMVVAGSPARPEGPYSSSIDLLRTGLFDAHKIRHIGVAGHPEGSPDIPPEAIAAAITEKNAIARDSDARFRIVTQFGFEAGRFIDWAEALARQGNALPIHVGVAGPAKITTLLKYAAICGVGASMDFLKKRASSLVALSTSYSPEAVVGPIEAYVAEHPAAPIRQIHVFPFGGLRRSAEWLAERGSWFSGDADAELDVIG